MKKICDLSSVKAVLVKANKPRHEYNLNEGNRYLMDTVNYIKKIGNKWEIGVFERGSFHDVHKYDTEAEACQKFIEDFYPKIANNAD